VLVLGDEPVVDAGGLLAQVLTDASSGGTSPDVSLNPTLITMMSARTFES